MDEKVPCELGFRARLLVDHRDDLVAERARNIWRLRWHLHELDPGWEPTLRSLDRASAFDRVAARLAGVSGGIVAWLARNLAEHCRQLTCEIDALEAEITTLVVQLVLSLLAICGCGPLTAAKIGLGVSSQAR